jgi:glycosyltransferase involved in cell wall biosynthesis
MKPARRILFFSQGCYFDNSNGASVVSRAVLELLARHGFVVEALTGSIFESVADNPPGMDLSRPSLHAVWGSDGVVHVDSGVMGEGVYSRGMCSGVSLTIHRSGNPAPHEPDALERGELIRSLNAIIDRFRPDVFMNFGGDLLAKESRSLARKSGATVVFPVHNYNYKNSESFGSADFVTVPSRHSAEYYSNALGIDCAVLPNLIDHSRSLDLARNPKYVVFVNPSIEKGVFFFARLAHELGRLRPDIPILVVESRGTEATVAACGLELRDHGNVFFMAHTPDPREFWGVTRVCLLPSVWWENQPLVAVEAMVNGIPVIGSDRGGIPETLGSAGIVLPIPDRFTQATRTLPTAEEVEPWVEAVIRLWDDPAFYEEHRRRAFDEARRWDPEVLEPRYVEFFRDLKPGPKPKPAISPGRSRAVVLVPYLNVIEPECEDSLRKLEAEGVRVVRSGGNSAIDVARNRLASEALHDGAEAILFIDSDIGFDPLDALRLLARPEPVVAGVYAKKGNREFASIFADGLGEVVFGAHAFGLYPLKYAATGFLRIRAGVLRRMIEELDLPECNTHWGKGVWPFFRPEIVPHGEGKAHYLGEDWAFSHRLARIGVTPMADTSIRLWHYGRYGYGWEDVGIESKRFATYTHRFGQ